MGVPHDGWAEHYDLVIEQTFGRAYGAFTRRTLDIVRDRMPAPARIVDFGAGTGRLAVPLARGGYQVTAVDPSRRMLDTLRARAEGVDVGAVVGRMEDYRTDAPHDLALCVFTVLVYVLDPASLTASAAAAAAAVRPGGLLLVDLPSPRVFESFELDTRKVIRCVDIEPLGEATFRFHERTAVRVGGRTVRYEEEFPIRYWTPEEIRAAFSEAGFTVREDLSRRFRHWGAGYLLMERRGAGDATP